jgi:hypothetical protein
VVLPSVRNTIESLRGLLAVETLDQFAKEVEENFKRWSAQRSGFGIVDREYIDK